MIVAILKSPTSNSEPEGPIFPNYFTILGMQIVVASLFYIKAIKTYQFYTLCLR